MKIAERLMIGALSASAIFGQTPAPAQPRVRVTTSAMSGQGYLGVNVREIDSERARELKLRDEHGVEITQVEDDSPASKAGLKSGDVLLEYNGQRVEGTEQFMRLIRETPPNRQVKFQVSRGGSLQTVLGTTGVRKWPGPGIQISSEALGRLNELKGQLRVEIPNMLTSGRSGMLGIDAEAVTEQLAQFFGVKSGVLIRSIAKNRPAEKAGLKAGDVITKIDDRAVSQVRDITAYVRSAKSKKSFPVTVARDKKELTLQVTMEEDETTQRLRAVRPAGVREEEF